MAVNPYISFDGNCREAVEFYANVFSLEKPEIFTLRDLPDNPDLPFDDSMKDLVMHTKLDVCGGTIMFSDSFGVPVQAGNNISVAIIAGEEQIKSFFEALKQGGTVKMELQKTEWSNCYGMVTDKFGITWQLNGSHS